MRLKQRPTDFKVRELLRDEVLCARGGHRVYRVMKAKHTSIEAAEVLGSLAGVSGGEVSIAGLKDRQGVTYQYMSIPRGRVVSHKKQDLAIETVGFAANELTSADSAGNEFEIVARDLSRREIDRLRAALPSVREHGLPNYFDDQRFGNLRHGQGWIALDLLHGRHEVGLKRLLTLVSKFDPPREKRFKSAIYNHWGDWGTCRDIAGRFGRHHSIFEYLRSNDGDFGGAFRHVSSRIRLIHLFAYQSHLWNRAVVAVMERNAPGNARFTLRNREGPLVFPKGEVPADPAWQGTFPLPGPRLAGVEHQNQRALFEELLAKDDLQPAGFVIEGVPGFALKPEPRAMAVVPTDLRVRPAEPDHLNRGSHMVRMRFSLPRGSYATLVVRRLIGPPREY